MPKRQPDSSPQIKKGNTWYIEWYFTTPDGKRSRIRKSVTDTGIELNSIPDLNVREIEAQKMLNALRTRLRPVSVDPDQELFCTALDIAVGLKRSDKEKTMKTFRETARWFKEFFQEKGWGGVRCSQVTAEMVQAYFDHIIVVKKVANTTHNTRKNNLRSLFTELVTRKYLPENFVKLVPERVAGAPKRRPMSPAEFEAYMIYVRKHDLPLYLCSLLLGYLAIRPGEERNLRCGAFDFAAGMVRFPGRDSKNNKDSNITIPEGLVSELESFGFQHYPATYYVFGKAKGRHNVDFKPGPERIGENTMAHRFRCAIAEMKKRGLLHDTTGLQLYSLKDTLALYLLNNGVDVVSAMHHFRQHSLDVFNRYVKRLGQVNQKVKNLPIDLPFIKS